MQFHFSLTRTRCAIGGAAVALAAALALGGTSTHADTEDPRRTPTVNAIERVMPSVVNIGTQELVETRDPFDEMLREFWGPYYRGRKPNKEYRYNLGSGVIIDEDGFVLTNEHVVRRASRIWVKLANGVEYEADRVVGNPDSDVALLKMRVKEGEKFTSVDFAADDDLLLGEPVIALGNPFGLGGSVSRGILSSKNRRPPMEDTPLDVADWLQTDAAINPGNSGGPLINLRGELIGLNVAVYKAGQGIGFAIPIRQVTRSLTDILTPEGIAGVWFGAKIDAGTLPLKIVEIEKGSPAEKAGLRAKDEIAEVRGKTPRSFIHFNRLLMRGESDEPAPNVDILVRRGLNTKELSVKLIAEKDFFNAAFIRKKLGVTVQPMTRDLAVAMGYNYFNPRKPGFVIADVEPDSAAQQANVSKGDVLRVVDGEELVDVNALARLLHAKKAGSTAKLGLEFRARRGRYIELRTYQIELPVRDAAG